jgi:hypothetical protein
MKHVALMALFLATVARADFDGRPWNVSTGNLSVTFIQHSPIGAFPQANFTEPPPSVEALKKLKAQGLVAYEDYVAWGAVEREPGRWDWTQHDRMYDALHAAGLKYVVYCWVHFPPAWLREDRERPTLMRCVEHDRETNYLSIFDPKTIEHYGHFYRALHEHFGEKIDDVYACILGPYGEGNYPLNVPDWVNIGHCHEGYWCGDPYALKAFRAAMRKKYETIDALNAAWGTKLASFDDVTPPRELVGGAFKPSPDAFKTAAERRRWLDFLGWYHQAIIDFAEQSIRVVLKYFPKEKVRTKPGGNAGGVNPIAWGTYCPGYAKMASRYGIVLQPADCQGAVFGDKWVGTAYQFYHVPLSTEPAGGLDKKTFVRRLFSDASAGASQLFTYEFEQHVPEIQEYAHLLTGKPGETQVAVYCPTTLYRLGGDLKPTIAGATKLRDVTDFDVLDELLIADGALNDRYRALVIFQGDVVERAILERIDAWMRRGGKVLIVGDSPIRDVEGNAWPTAGDCRTSFDQIEQRLGELLTDGKRDGIWTTRRGGEVLLYNTTAQLKPLPASLSADGGSRLIEPGEIVELPTSR